MYEESVQSLNFRLTLYLNEHYILQVSEIRLLGTDALHGQSKRNLFETIDADASNLVLYLFRRIYLKFLIIVIINLSHICGILFELVRVEYMHFCF